MSLLLDAAAASSSSSSSSPRDCSKRGLSHQLRSRLISRKLLLLLSTPLLSLLFLLLLLWRSLRPSAPEFSLRDAALLLPPPPPSSPSADPLPAAAAVTAVVAAKNPNAHVGAFYDRLRVRAACAGEPPAAEAAVPGFYQEPRAVSTVSAVVGPTVLREPQRSGLLMEIRLQGRLRWKVGMWVSRGYGFEVACLAVVEVGPRPAAGTSSSSSSVPLSQCSTSM